MYSERYQLPELTAFLVAHLERRRAAFSTWNQQTEASLLNDAKEALAQARAQFLELFNDPAYWDTVERTLLTVALPRYLLLAKEQHGVEQRKYDTWRGGDFVSRAVYAVSGLGLGLVLWRLRLPWVEPAAVGLFLFGPLIPDLQTGFSRRRYQKALTRLVTEMGQEQADRHLYEPLGVAPVTDEADAEARARVTAERDRTS